MCRAAALQFSTGGGDARIATLTRMQDGRNIDVISCKEKHRGIAVVWQIDRVRGSCVEAEDAMISELQKNSLGQLRRTLEDLASRERQIAYKRAVPFVHVPIELFVQWDNYTRLLAEADWFAALFSESHRAALHAYSAKVEIFRARHGDHCPDVEEVLALPEWQALMTAAGELLNALQIPPES